MSLEHQLATAGGKASLLDSLSFEIPPAAPYVVARRSCYSYSSTGTRFSYNTQRVCRIPLTSDAGEWCDLSTLRVQLTFANNTADPQHFRMRDPVSCVQRLRVFCAGTLVEYIHARNRVNEMMRILSPPGSNANDAVEGFGMNVSALEAPNSDNMFILTVGKSITVSLHLHRVSGLLSCGKDLPLHFCPLTLELEFADGNLFMNQNTNYTITNACARHDSDPRFKSGVRIRE